MSIFKSDERHNLSTIKSLNSLKSLIVLVGAGAIAIQAASANPAYDHTNNRIAMAPMQQNQWNRSPSIAPPRVRRVVSRNNLPPTTLDSFVYEAGGQKEEIYGDEGVNGLPPYRGFSYQHRMNAGIVGQSDAGLTTGHGSYMPSAWGADEFLAPPGEWSASGANDGNPELNHADAALNRADQHDETQRDRDERLAIRYLEGWR